MTNLIRFICFFLVSGAVFADDAGNTRLCVRGQIEAPISFHGAVNYDRAGAKNGAQVMYPAAGLAGLIAAVATHAAISNGLRESEKKKLRAAADVILEPYQATLGNYKHQELMQAALSSMTTPGDKRIAGADADAIVGETLIDSVPAFYMTQDQRAIVLENTVSIRRQVGEPYVKVIRVVSAQQADKGNAELWLADEALRLKMESVRLYARSLDIAMLDLAMSAQADAPFKTVRYFEGGAEKMERAQVISEQCDHVVLRTLRGNVLSVPRSDPEASCNAG